MRWVLAFHIIFVIAWFAGLFYLPRLFVYHTQTTDKVGLARFKTMEHKLFYYIMTPAGILATVCGDWYMFSKWTFSTIPLWLHSKLALVALLWLFHIVCGKYVYDFKYNKNHKSEKFYRIFNEIPTILLIGIVLLVTLKPQF